MQRRVAGRRRALSGLAVAAFLAGSALVAGCDSSSSSSAAPSSPPTSQPSSSAPTRLPRQTLTFGVVGSADEVASYRQMASLFAPLNRQVTVEVKAWPDEAAMMADLRAGAKPPDVFIASRRDLVYLDQHQLIQPIDQLLDDRGVDFGDDYPRSTLTAFGSNNHLTCLPYGIAPSVIYYNKRLVKLGQVSADPPVPGQGWSLDQFAATAQWAVRHHPNAAGAYVEPSLGGIAPFVLSGGGRIFDDATAPTALTLSDGASQQALIRTVRVMHRPGISLSPQQLAEKTPLQWFEQGRLALLEGSRDIVPALRSRLLFNFDVMPMPRPRDSRHRRRADRPVHLERRHRRGHRRGLPGLRLLPGGARGRRVRRLPPAGQPDGRPLRRLPTAWPTAPTRVGLHVQRQEHAVPTTDRPVGRARRRGRSRRSTR